MEPKALMTPVGRRMLAPLANLRDEMDRLFNHWLASADFEPVHLLGGEGFLPRIDATEGEKELEVTVELPGVQDADIEIELTRTALLLRGQKKVETEEKAEGYLRKERRFGSFYREIPLPWEVDVATSAPDATFANGVLTVKVPKPKGAKKASRKVAIHV
jgi:HSP20 family protein